MPDDVSTQPLSTLFANLTREIGDLIKQQAALAQAELNQKISRVGWSVARVAIGGLVAVGGVLSVIAGIVMLVTRAGVPPWVSALAVGVALAAIGYFIAQQALSSLKADDLKPRTTIETLKESAEWVKSPTKT
jgi:hypothetical protein